MASQPTWHTATSDCTLLGMHGSGFLMSSVGSLTQLIPVVGHSPQAPHVTQREFCMLPCWHRMGSSDSYVQVDVHLLQADWAYLSV